LISFEQTYQSIARESLRLDVLRDALGNEPTSDEISQRELDLDKEIIQLIQNACKNDKLPRVLELTKMLHHTPSFDMALKVAGFYHLIGLQEKIGFLKEERDSGDDDFRENARQQRKQWVRDSAAVLPPRPAGEFSSYAHQGARALQDFGPPPAIHRPGLTRAIAADPSRVSTTSSAPSPEWNDPGFGEGSSGSTDFALDGKRKRDEEQQPIRDPLSAESEGGSKRRALAPFAPSKPSESKIFSSLPRRCFSYEPPVVIEPNPFAKKPEGENNQNPFARSTEKSLHKSETFFDKVEAAETGSCVSKRTLYFLTQFFSSAKERYLQGSTTKGKSSEKKTVTRQTTLFGMPAVQPSDKDKGRKKTAASGKEPQNSMSGGVLETQEDQDLETQSTDATMIDAGTSQIIVETCTGEAAMPLEKDIQDNDENGEEEEVCQLLYYNRLCDLTRNYVDRGDRVASFTTANSSRRETSGKYITGL
jgi:chromosome transmission fidelity protein 4